MWLPRRFLFLAAERDGRGLSVFSDQNRRSCSSPAHHKLLTKKDARKTHRVKCFLKIIA